ncbi:MAG TPA: hypothetical protein VFU36_06700 [Jatrophihabitans sp.]|nr:hypothetical protein [Jatrophihabitans sp.]
MNTRGQRDPLLATFRLASIGIAPRGQRLLSDAWLCHLAAEDACLQFATEAWRKRRPRGWQLAARRSWRDEGDLLDAQRRQLISEWRLQSSQPDS